jgi:hypothetical protein
VQPRGVRHRSGTPLCGDIPKGAFARLVCLLFASPCQVVQLTPLAQLHKSPIVCALCRSARPRCGWRKPPGSAWRSMACCTTMVRQPHLPAPRHAELQRTACMPLHHSPHVPCTLLSALSSLFHAPCHASGTGYSQMGGGERTAHVTADERGNVVVTAGMPPRSSAAPHAASFVQTL